MTREVEQPEPETPAASGVRAMVMQRARAVAGDSLVRNSVMVMGTTIVNAGFGYLYWMVAANLFEDATVGRATAVISAMNLTALVANLGLGTSLVQHLPGRKSEEAWRSNVSATILLGLGTALTLATIVAFALPAVLDAFGPIMDGPMTAFFIFGAAAWVMSVIFDHLFIAERRAEGMLIRNASFACGKLLLLLPVGLAAMDDERWLVGTWVLGAGLSVIGAATLLVPRIGRRIRLQTEGAGREIKGLLGTTFGHHLANLGGEFPMFLLPVIVISRAGDEASAYFYVTWMVGSIFFTVSGAASASLFAEGSHDPSAAAGQLRRAMMLIGVLLTPVALGMVVIGQFVLGLFGEAYANEGYGLLLLLVVSAVPDAVTNIWVARWRVLGWIGQTAVANVGMAVIALAYTWWKVPEMGIAAAGWGWIISQSIGTVYTFLVEGWHWLRNGRQIAVPPPHPDSIAAPEEISS
ncbi:MAG: lipopolysaccharide biosynthesis protein [Actinomycetota bacterium]